MQAETFTKRILPYRCAFPLTRDRCILHSEQDIQHVAPDKGLCGAKVEDRHATQRHEAVISAVNRDLRGEIFVLERNDAAGETGAVF